jgi:hypothetical protein
VRERRAVDVALAVTECRAVGGVRNAAAAAIGLGDTRQDAADADEHVRERRDVEQVVGVDQYASAVPRQPVAAQVRRRVVFFYVDEAGDCLLLQPLLCVASATPVLTGARYRPSSVPR